LYIALLSLFNNLETKTAKDNIPLAIECAGLIDCNLYQQKGRLILHFVNLTSAGTWRQPVDEYIPIRPVKVRVKLSENVRGRRVQLLVADQKISGEVEKGWVQFTVNSILDHEVVVITY